MERNALEPCRSGPLSVNWGSQSASCSQSCLRVKIWLPGEGKICVLHRFSSRANGFAHNNNTIRKVKRKSPGPGVIPGSWQSQGIGSPTPVKSAMKSKLSLISAISLALLCFPVWTWKVIGAKSMTVDGNAARREYLFTLNRGRACSGCGLTQDMLSHPLVWSFFQKGKKKSRLL